MLTFLDSLSIWAAEKADQPAYVFLEKGEEETARLTYGELHRSALAISARLIENGLGGKPVILTFPPGLDYVKALLGCFYAGTIAVPVPFLLPKRSGERIAAISRQAGPAAVLTSSRLAADTDLRAAVTSGSVVVPWIATDAIEGEVGAGAALRRVAADAVAVLQYTSGSTSAPKGVEISHANLVANQAMIQAAFGSGEGTRMVTWLPPFHDMGLVGTLLHPLFVGGVCIMMPPFAFLQKPIRWLKAVTRYQGTTGGAPNFAYELCVQNTRPEQREGLDLRSWELAFCGAEPVRGDTLSRFAETYAPMGFRRSALYPCYGLAEATLFVSGPPLGEGMRSVNVDGRRLVEEARIELAAQVGPTTRALVSCGRPWGEERIEIVEPETLRRARPGHAGEIWISGPHIGQGYWRDPEETAKAFGARLAEEGDDTPFLRTGDIGFLREGELFVTGRLKDLIIIRGAKHHPEEIEATVSRSHPALAGAGGAAFSIEGRGEPQLVILQEIARRQISDAEANEAARAAFGAITHEHGVRPSSIVLVRTRSLPRTTSGKVQRHRCRAAFLADELSAIRLAPIPSIKTGVA